MQTIIIGDGLTPANLSADHPHRSSQFNVGRREIERLMGKGKAYGEGPLPTFLREALEASGKAPITVLFLESAAEDQVEGGEATLENLGTRFVEPLEKVALDAVRVPAPLDSIPLEALTRAFEMAGLCLEDVRNTRFLVVGCHTERRILGLASLLRNVLRCRQTAVCSHLVGSATQEAHFAALRHTLPSAGVHVFLDLEEAAEHCGLNARSFEPFNCRPCEIEPDKVREQLDDYQRRIVQLLCMHWTKAHLRPLAGGFSGSALFLADGWKGNARTEPLVVKIDAFSQMRRELDGYHQVKDFFGKHVPTFGFPVTGGDSLGVGMDLAAMEGRPVTLQDTFEGAEGEEGLSLFLMRLDKLLMLLSQKLYGNTKDSAWVVPYRTFGLHAEQQLKWMRENAGFILSYLEETGKELPTVNAEQIEKLLRLITSNEDGVESEVCLSHGDLNFANVICDNSDNMWFIDWTHSGQSPVELDFAKLENDVKFVMTKEFDAGDLPRMRELEEYLLSQRIPADVGSLPNNLKFVKWDLRFRKIIDAVHRIREACFRLKKEDDWLVYRIALLRYALHTLSFDKRREKGECNLPQLMHALYSIELLVYDLVADDFHLKIRGERPASYPPRLRISIDTSPWPLDCEEYDPPYHVDALVLENDRTKRRDGWADPEDFELVKEEPRVEGAKFKDEEGRPRNPRGRTGIAGRGLLGYWGPNLSVAATVTRMNPETGEKEILLGATEGQSALELPKGFVLHEETPEAAIKRVLDREVGWDPEGVELEIVFDGFTYHRKQTDNAWVESRVFLLQARTDWVPSTFEAGRSFDEVQWWPLSADTVNRMPSGQACFVREVIVRLMETDRFDRSAGDRLLEGTG